MRGRYHFRHHHHPFHHHRMRMHPLMFRFFWLSPMIIMPLLFGVFIFWLLASKLIFLLPIVIGVLLLGSWGRNNRKHKESVIDDFYGDEKPKRKNDEIIDDRIDYV